MQCIVLAASEVAATRSIVRLEVPDDRLDGLASFGQTVFLDEVLKFFGASEQLVDQFVADGHASSFSMFGSFLPFDRLHKI